MKSLGARLLLLVPLSLALEGCCDHGPEEALSTPPDRECMTGVEVGDDIAIWDCVDQQHVVAFRRASALFGCSAVQVQRVPCGQLTPYEQALDGDPCEYGRPRGD
ncbi:hypothetical protein [Archangium lansingense]|uniref:Lipoprotein n=1 Tax=Archangium lansingense TaxID=2995310 RepID=A0ABT4AIQ7_9BACT|nr:hypothetical protein [Archangium lansinium]MCY1081545.1 hypothetical protein [Archangium lansinium]